MSKRKSTNLRVCTNSWSTKRNENKAEEEKRPLTATLEKPQIIDIQLLGKIDMSLMRKEFFNITNICRIPLNINKIPLNQRQLPRLPSSNSDLKFNEGKTLLESSEKRMVLSSVKVSSSKVPNRNLKKVASDHQSLKMQSNELNNNSLELVKAAKKGLPKNTTSMETKSTKLPEPCKTCGRPDQPERFHSHPVTPLKPSKDIRHIVKIAAKNIVQKPFAIKYKSRMSDMKPSPLVSPPPTQNVVHSPLVNKSVADGQVQMQSGRPRTGKGSKMLICYICGREYGTASLPLHEPKCIEKWERENANLPKNQRRALPQKPDTPMTPELWNQRAWEICQASLVPCKNCMRTFLPERLVVHQRSCRPQQTMVELKE